MMEKSVIHPVPCYNELIILHAREGSPTPNGEIVECGHISPAYRTRAIKTDSSWIMVE